MAYWVDEGFHSWPEIIRAGTAAAGLYIRCGSYIADHTLDGFIPAEVAAQFGTREWIQRLVDVGLWEIEEHGYRDVYYFGRESKKLNPTAATVKARREANAARQAAFRERHKGRSKGKRVSNAVSNAPRNGSSNALLTLPPNSPLKGGEGRAPAHARGAARAPTCPTCANRLDSPYHRNVCQAGPRTIDDPPETP